MSKSAFAGFCLTAFAGGVLTTVVVDRSMGRSRGPSPRAAIASPPPPAPFARPAIAPEFQALPPKRPASAVATGVEARPAVIAEKETKGATGAARAAVRARAAAPRKGTTAGASASKQRGDLEPSAQPRTWTDPFAD